MTARKKKFLRRLNLPTPVPPRKSNVRPLINIRGIGLIDKDA